MKVLRTKTNKTEIPPDVKIQKKWDSRTYYGKPEYGVGSYGALDDMWGIYQLKQCKEGKISVREKFYVPTQTWSQAKQDAQEKFAAAVAAYQLLTAEQKKVYHRSAVGFNYSGYNLFIINYMKS